MVRGMRKAIALCEYEDELGRHQLAASLDELSLTYKVVQIHQQTGGRRLVMAHLPSLAAARSWAEGYSARALRHSG